MVFALFCLSVRGQENGLDGGKSGGSSGRGTERGRRGRGRGRGTHGVWGQRGWEEKNYISISIPSMRFESLFYGRNCQTENKHLIFLFLCLHLVPTRCFPILSMLETVSSSYIPSVELEKNRALLYRGGKSKKPRVTLWQVGQLLVSNRIWILLVLACVSEHHCCANAWLGF